jgi:hypothetical protein
MTTTTSRRALLAGAATLPVASLPALADPALASEATGPSHPDAKLLRLSVKLEALIDEWIKLRTIDETRLTAWMVACDRAGLPDIEHGSIPDDEWRANNEKRAAVRYEYSDEEDAENDEDGASIIWSDFCERQHALCDKIYTYKAHTVAGLAVQARAFSVDWQEMWEYDSDDDGGKIFADLVCSFLGVTPAPVELAERKAVQS